MQRKTHIFPPFVGDTYILSYLLSMIPTFFPTHRWRYRCFCQHHRSSRNTNITHHLKHSFFFPRKTGWQKSDTWNLKKNWWISESLIFSGVDLKKKIQTCLFFVYLSFCRDLNREFDTYIFSSGRGVVEVANGGVVEAFRVLV